jgi:hypothetical protein
MSSVPCIRRASTRRLRGSRGASTVPPFHTRAPGIAFEALASSAVGGRLRRLKLLSTSLSIAGALFAFTPDLRAQEATGLPLAAPPSLAVKGEDGAPSVRVVPVVVATREDGLLLTVAQPGNQQAIVSCYHQCSFLAVSGSYTLWATNPGRRVHYQTTLHVGQRTTFWVSSGEPAARTAGLIAGIAGPIATISGVVLGLSQVLAEQCNESNCPPPKDHPVALGLVLGGLFATPIGWTIFATSGPRVNPVDDKPIKYVREQRLQLGVLALPRGGWSVGLSTPF